MSDVLTAIDDALETGAADHHDPLTRELQELALALRADAPEADRTSAPAPTSASRRGFPKPSRAPRRPLWRRDLEPRLRDRPGGPAAGADRRRGRWLGQSDQDDGGGGGGSVAVESGGDGSRGRGASDARRRRERRPEARDRALGEAGAQRAADQAAGSAPAVVLPPDGGFAPGQRNRKIERSIGLELEMPVDRWRASPSRSPRSRTGTAASC